MFSWVRTPYEPSKRLSRLTSCHNSVSKMVLRACKIIDSIGASSGRGRGRVEEPVTVEEL